MSLENMAFISIVFKCSASDSQETQFLLKNSKSSMVYDEIYLMVAFFPLNYIKLVKRPKLCRKNTEFSMLKQVVYM
jgi:hypothetical protein